MEDKTTFESDIRNLSNYINITGGRIDNIKNRSKDGISVLRFCNDIEEYVDKSINIITKYEKFLKKLKSKFAYDIRYDDLMSQTVFIKNAVKQIRLNVANSEFENVAKRSEHMQKEYQKLRNSFAPIMSLPYVMNYSTLSRSDWRLIGIPGLHYRSKIFLSYPFRNSNPAKDENQQMINTYIIPLLKQVNIQPITARSELNYHDLIDDDIINLIKDCDGIVGIFTKNDNIDNIEHELSFNKNIIAICKEEGAKAPSMRYSRLMLNFDRGDMGYFILELLKALKNKGMFYLKI